MINTINIMTSKLSSRLIITKPGFAKLKSVQSLSRYRTFKAPISHVILDWSGTTIDEYVWSVALAILRTFDHFKVPITNQEARGPMGNNKLLHMRKLLETPSIAEKFHKTFNRRPGLIDLHTFFDYYSEEQLNILKNDPKMTQLLPEVKSTLDVLKSKLNIHKIGTTSGFLDNMQQVILEKVKAQGFVPDFTIGSDVVKRSRPYPDAMWTNLLALEAPHVDAVVKVDDTKSGILEGLNAGTWSVGVAKYNNFIGEQHKDYNQKFTKEEFSKLLEKSREHLREANPHFIIDTLFELPTVIDIINKYQSDKTSDYVS